MFKSYPWKNLGNITNLAINGINLGKVHNLFFIQD